MGFLDGSTNNILVDAVLTDIGRKKLSENGSLSFAMFAFSDDEVNYFYTEQYGLTVGKEKIIKNTPIMEAQTIGTLAQKYKVVSLNNAFNTELPTLSLVSETVNGALESSRSSSGTRVVTCAWKQVSQPGTIIDLDLTDYSCKLVVNHLFVQVKGSIPDSIDIHQNATYTISNTSTNNNLASFSVDLITKPVSDAVFLEYAYSNSGTSTADIPVFITGNSSGQSLLVIDRIT
tara:strand:- start:528 stop:1223 length:696 start_codon:yes stop_codon:yes gene_type:complete